MHVHVHTLEGDRGRFLLVLRLAGDLLLRRGLIPLDLLVLLVVLVVDRTVGRVENQAERVWERLLALLKLVAEAIGDPHKQLRLRARDRLGNPRAAHRHLLHSGLGRVHDQFGGRARDVRAVHEHIELSTTHTRVHPQRSNGAGW